MLYIYWLISVFGGILKRKSKFLTVVLLVFVGIIYGFNTYSGDYENYKYVYQYLNGGNLYFEFEPLYTLLMMISLKMGLSFEQFRIVLAILYCILLYIVLNEYTDESLFCIALFLVFPFPYFVSVLRAGIACLFIAHAVKKLHDENNGIKKFVFWLLVATLFHYTSLFFAMLLLFKNNNNNTKKIGYLLALIIVISIAYYSGFMYKVVLMFVNNYRVTKWLDPNNVSIKEKINLKWLLYEAIIIIVNIGFVKIFKDRIKEGSNRNIANTIYNANLLMIMLLPLSVISVVFFRVVWEVVFLNILLCGIMLEESRSKEKKGVIKINKISVIFVLWIVFILIYANMPYASTKNNLIYVFQNNIFG